jgi:anion-transporting  ArsA/GET3 family ATPase
MGSTDERHLERALAEKRILVCVGSGGVGKTTTAAALALEAALSGRKTLVLTIDPAKRLANSLGLAELGHEIQQVPQELLNGGDGSLHAMMLDQEKAFNEVVEKHASNPEAIERILANPVYQQISRSLAGSQEYAALAKLHDLDKTGDWELIIVDTPPTAHALDFLDAPRKLSEAIDSPAIEWFRKLRGEGGSRWSLVGRSGTYVLKKLAKFVGSQFIDDLAVFFTEFNDVLGGFRSRAEEVFALLRQPAVGFVLVASPEPMAVREALFFHRRLTDSEMPLAGFVINRVHERRPVDIDEPGLVKQLGALDAVAALGLQPGTLRIAAEAMLASHREQQILADADARSREKIWERAAGLPVAEVPQFDHDIHHIDRLAELGRFLVAGEIS